MIFPLRLGYTQTIKGHGIKYLFLSSQFKIYKSSQKINYIYYTSNLKKSFTRKVSFSNDCRQQWPLRVCMVWWWRGGEVLWRATPGHVVKMDFGLRRKHRRRKAVVRGQNWKQPRDKLLMGFLSYEFSTLALYKL